MPAPIPSFPAISSPLQAEFLPGRLFIDNGKGMIALTPHRYLPLELSSNRPIPAIMDDPFGTPGSLMSVEKSFDYDEAEDNLWNSFWSPVKTPPPTPTRCCQADPTTGSPRHPESFQFSSLNRNFASINLSGLDASTQPSLDLHRSGAVRTPHRSQRRQFSAGASYNTPKSSYSPFPPTPAARKCPVETSHLPHKSWSTRLDSRESTRPLRARANTTPVNARVHCPSNLSTCTTVDGQSQCTSPFSDAPLYMRSAPSTPQYAPLLMELMGEKSVFEEDDDEDEKSKVMRVLESTLHIRNWSSHSTKDKDKATVTEREVEEHIPADNPKGSLRLKGKARKASEALRGVLGIKKQRTSL